MYLARTIVSCSSTVCTWRSRPTTRAAVNDWIRNAGAYDAVIDFEPIVGDPSDPGSMKADLTCDYVHPNQAGYQAMANSIDLSLFD